MSTAPDPSQTPTPTVAPPRSVAPPRILPVEVRVLDMLSGALDRQTDAVIASAERQERALDALGLRVEQAAAGVRLLPWLVGLIALSIVILGGAIGVSSTAHLAGDGLSVGAAPVAAGAP